MNGWERPKSDHPVLDIWLTNPGSLILVLALTLGNRSRARHIDCGGSSNGCEAGNHSSELRKIQIDSAAISAKSGANGWSIKLRV